MPTLTWKRHDSFEAQGDNGETWYVNWEGDGYTILLKFVHRGRTKWQFFGIQDTLEKAKEFCEGSSVILKKVAAFRQRKAAA